MTPDYYESFLGFLPKIGQNWPDLPLSSIGDPVLVGFVPANNFSRAHVFVFFGVRLGQQNPERVVRSLGDGFFWQTFVLKYVYFFLYLRQFKRRVPNYFTLNEAFGIRCLSSRDQCLTNHS